ncbi:hypothetical protein Tco_1186402 [Tanacetum coccineum]
MADLTFVDSHNMVAYLEKSEDNVDFAEIVDFLNASPIRYALTTIVITESSVRRDLHFNDEDGILFPFLSSRLLWNIFLSFRGCLTNFPLLLKNFIDVSTAMAYSSLHFPPREVDILHH